MCLGDKPELAFRGYRATLAGLGHRTTAEYVERACRDRARLRAAAAHQRRHPVARRDGAAAAGQRQPRPHARERLAAPARARAGAPVGARQGARGCGCGMLREAGELRIPFTTGLLIGIGETLAERVDTLLAIRDLHRAHGHVQEVIVQNFRAKPTIPLADAPEPDALDLARTVAVARLVLDPEVSVQAPPNLSPDDHALLLRAGLNDWGGISPLTPDYVNPEAPWPHVAALAATCRAAGYTLRRAPADLSRATSTRPGWLDPALRPRVEALATARRSAVPPRWRLRRHELVRSLGRDRGRRPVRRPRRARARARHAGRRARCSTRALARRELSVADCEALLGVDGRRPGRAGARRRRRSAPPTWATRSPTSSTATSTSPTSAS